MTRLSRVLATLLLLSLPPLPRLAADQHPEEEAILAATLKQQIEFFLDEGARARRTVVCLGINPGHAPQSPSREFLARFVKEPAARGLGACERKPKEAIESTSGAPAVIVTAGPIEWIAEDEAWVTVAHFRTRLHSGIGRYRVVRERSGWVSLGPIYRDGPL
jgi:hypothetical protein